MKRFMGVLLALCLLFCTMAAAEPLAAAGYETESVTRNWETNAFFSRMTALTGIEVTGRGISEEKEYLSFLSQMMTGEPECDILFKACLTRDQERGLIESGAVIDLAPLIEENMPNLSALLVEHPEWRTQIALEDGRIASLPFINLHERQVCAWLNAEWLETLGVPFPETLDGLTDALKAISTGDPNKNGKLDEAALNLVGVYEMKWLLPFFGVVADDYNVCRLQDGTLAFAPDQPEYRTFVETLKSWYDLGLMRSDAFTAAHSALQLTENVNSNSSSNNKKPDNTIGMLVTVTPYTSVDADDVLNYRAVLIPGPDGRTRWRDLLGPVWPGTFAVTRRCKDPASALRWVDALYSEEGAALAYVGVEGEDYQYTQDGYWEYILGDSSEIESIRSNKIIYTGTTIPGQFPYRIVEAVDSEADRHVFAESEKVHACSERVLPSYFLPAEISDEVSDIMLKLTEQVDRGIARFVTGEIPLDDANWTAWQTALHDAGSARLVELLER